MADKNIRAGVDGLMGKGCHKVRGLFEVAPRARCEKTLATEFVTVHADDDPVRLPARLANPSHIVFAVALVRLGGDRKGFIEHIPVAQQHQLRCFVVRDFFAAIKVLTVSLLAHFET